MARILLGGVAVWAGASVVRAQSAISVTSTSSTGWNAWYTGAGAVMTDPQNDQQTGQHTDDYVGDATHYGMQQTAGTIGGTDYVAWRFRFDDYSGADKFGGNGGNAGLGLDLDGNGSVDVMMVMSEGSGNVNNRARTVYFGTPGAGANTGPSTTTWTIDTNQTTAVSLTVNTTYDLQATNDGFNFAGTQDSWLTFAVSFANMQAGIRAYAGPAFSNFVYDYTTKISYIAFTSTQLNALNQDLFGASKAALTNGTPENTATWADLGAITPQIDAFGRVPEPATYAQLGALLLAGGVVAYRRQRLAARRR
ncbi:MAG: hypothetical protein KF715_03785 [Candidatus Didemnitutus sp.]|nr:hypothetical protein [Candidatus Didemnitutus sp.]